MSAHPSAALIETGYAWRRLWVSFALMTIGGSGMYVVTVVLPLLQKEFSSTRADASVPWLLTTLGFGFGAIAIGRISDRWGIYWPSISGGVFLGVGFIAAAQAQSLWQFALIQGIVISLLGGAASFIPLVADVSHWFSRRRGIAMSICISGNFAAGVIWPPVFQHFFDLYGWRATFNGAAVVCLLVMIPLALMLKKRSPVGAAVPQTAAGHSASRPLGFRPGTLQALLAVAGLSCCMAMAIPQVHIVAYCGDLGYGAIRGAQMLSLMLAAGIASRIFCGWLSDMIGGLRTLLLGSVAQCIGLALFVPFDSVGSLYALSILFGFFQGGIVPAYPLVVREYFSPSEASGRTGAILMVALFGMGIGGWLGGVVFDLTGAYRNAFALAAVANLLNIAIVAWLISRAGSRPGSFAARHRGDGPRVPA